MKNKPAKLAPLDRRGFLEGLAAGAGGLALAGCGGGGGDPLPPPFEPPPPASTAAERNALARPALPAAALSGIDRIVLVTMENRSFDHFLGWLPQPAEGLPPGLRYSDAFGDVHPVFPLAPHPDYGYESCGWSDPNHTYEGGRTHFAEGKLNGWLLTRDTRETRGDRLPIGYYGGEDLAFYKRAAEEYVVCDYYFSGILSETIPNRIYLHSGQTDRLGNSLVDSDLPTIWDRLADKSISRRYYFHDAPFTALYGARYVDISRKVDEFYADAAAGDLPAFSMVDPRFGNAAAGTSNDDHPHADVRNGQAFLGKVYEALRTSPNWSTTLMIVVYDEWGGFFDHVAPPIRKVSAEEAALGNDGRLGFRVPCLLLGPRVPRGAIARYPFDPSSIHQLLNWRFDLAPLGVRAGEADTFNLAYALDFASAARDPVQLPLVSERAADCAAAAPATAGERKAAQSAPPAESPQSSEAALPGGRFNDLWRKALENGFAL